MANWKKVVVSGSAVSQLQNDAGYLTSGTIVQANGFATASVGAVEIIAKSSTGSFSYASGSGNGLNITGNAGTNVITFDLLNIPNTSLTNDDVTIGSTAIALGGTSTTLAGLTNVSSTSFSGSFSGSFEGNGSLLTGIASTLTVQGDTGGTSTVDLLTQTFDVAGGTNINTVTSGQTVTVNLDNVITVTDATVTGDLIVQGTASFQNTENLQIADRFILMASGSTSVGDGGIVVQQATQDFGELFGYDQANTRWAVTGSFDSATSAFTPDAFMSTVVEGVGADPTAVVAKYTNKGNIFVGNDEGIWIYS